MESITRERKNVLYHNLLYLGTDNELFEKKYNVSLHRNMFVTPNRKGFEAVTHFLFSTLSAITQEKYNLPWPLLDKEAGREFQKTCFGHLTNFSQEGIVKFPRIVPSFLSTFGGERFYEIYMAFSTYVLVRRMKKDGIRCLARPVVSKDSYQAVQNTLQLSTISHVANIKETLCLMCASQSDWTKISQNLSLCLERSKKLGPVKEAKENDLKSMKEFLSMPPEETINFKKLFKKTLELSESKKRLKMKKFFSNENKFWMHLDSEIGSDTESMALDIQDFDPAYSSLPKELAIKFKEISVSGDKAGENLTVLKFIKMLLVCLKFKIYVLGAGHLCQLHEDCTAKDVSDMKECYLNSVKVLENLLNFEIPSTEKNIQDLGEGMFYDHSNNAKVLSQIPLEDFSIEALSLRLNNFEPGELINLVKLD